MKRISHALAGLGMLALVSGCRSKEPEPYQTYFKDPPAYTPAPNSTNAFDAYLAIGKEAAETLNEPQTATNTPGARDILRKKAEPLLVKLEAASHKPCQFQFQASRPLMPHPSRAGWAKLSRALAWSVKSAVKAQDWTSVVRWTTVGLTVGYDLAGGDALDASTGLTMADSVRTSAAEGLAAMPADSLAKLSKGARDALLRLPAETVTLQNEHENELAAIQTLQDAYKSRKEKGLDPIGNMVYKDGKDAVAYLEKMSDDERPKYFKGLAAEVEENNAFRKQHVGAVPKQTNDEAAARTKELDKEKYRPWRSLMPHFFGSFDTFNKQRVLSLTRTRIFVLACLAQQNVKQTGKAPDIFKQIGGDLTVDPYSGRAFGYAHAGADFNVYSAGEDGRDDGGESDSLGLHPDVRLIGTPS